VGWAGPMLPTLVSLRSMLRSQPMAAFCRARAAAVGRAVLRGRLSRAVARRSAWLAAEIRARGRRFGRWSPAAVPALAGAPRLPAADAWSERLASAPFRTAILPSLAVHAAGRAGLVAGHQMHRHDEGQPAITIKIAPADPDARVGVNAGID